MLLVTSGILGFFISIGFLSGSGWAWTLGIVLGIINSLVLVVELAFGIGFAALGIVSALITILYLNKPTVRVFFGKGVSNYSSQTSTGSAMTHSSTPPASSGDRACRKCGANVPGGASFCRTCGTIQ
jgi:hypothetical protein